LHPLYRTFTESQRSERQRRSEAIVEQSQMIQLVIKELHVSLVRSSLKAGVVLIAGIALSGCVVRPLGWGGDRDGYRHGGRTYVDSDRDRGRSPGYDNSRDGTRRRGW